MRDRLKSGKYFEKYLSNQIFYKNDYLNLYDEVAEKDGENGLGAKRALIVILKHCYQYIWAKYSAGGSITSFEGDIENTIPYLRKGWQGESGYVQILWLLSISICLEIEDEIFDQLVALVDKDGLKDQLLDYLIAYRIPSRKINDTLQFPKPYASLISATTWGKSIAQTILKTYLEKKWYPGHSDCGWHDSHKSPHNTYFGYWSFEAAAIVKIMELDDASFKDNQYYPYDLVHWKK